MTTYSKETALYDTGAISSGITGAGQTASKYITAVDSNGIKVHAENNPTSNYSLINANGMQVYKSSSAIASFGETTTIGKMGGTQSYLQADYHSLQLIDKEGTVYFHISDLRDTTGKATISQTWYGDGSSLTFNFDVSASTTSYSVYVDGVDKTSTLASRSTNQFKFSSAPASGAVITCSYTTQSAAAKAYTIGIRNSSGDIGASSFACGRNNTASGYISYAEGQSNVSSANFTHVEGSGTTASKSCAHAEGVSTTASGINSHAECQHTTASGGSSHAEGSYATASGYYSHAEGAHTTARNTASHAEGSYTTASGQYSHAQNRYTIANGDSQTALGTYNIEDNSNAFSVIVGNGTNSARSNALTVDWSGNVDIASGAKYKINGTALSAADVGAVSDVQLNGVSVKSGTVANLSIVMTDFIVEQGTSGNWKYRKWESSKFEAWHSGSVALTNDGQLSSYNPTWYRSHYAVTVPSAIGTITIETAICSNTSPTSFHMQGNTAVSGSTITQYCIRGGGTLTGNVTAYVYVTGTYS